MLRSAGSSAHRVLETPAGDRLLSERERMRLLRTVSISGILLVAGAMLTGATTSTAAGAVNAAAASPHTAINCEYSSLCAEVANPADVFGSEYVGHDEPSLVPYSNVP